MGKDVEVRLGADSSEFEATLNRVDKNVDKLANSATANIARLGEAWRGVKDMAGDVVDVVQGIMQGLNELVAPAAAIERVEAQMRGLTGSAYEAKRVIAEVNKYALESQYTPTKLFENAMQLIRGGLDSGYAPELVRQLSVVAQGDQAKMDALVNSVLKGTQKGWGMEVLEGFNQAQVDMMGALRTSTGLNEAELKDAISKQKIAFEDIAGAIRELARDDGALAAANEELGNTLEGSQKRFENAWGNLQESFGAGLLEPMTELMDGLGEIMLSLETEAKALGEEAGGYVKDIVSGTVDILMGLRANLETIKAWLPWVIRGVEALAVAWASYKSKAVAAMVATRWELRATASGLVPVKTAFAGMWASFKAGCTAMRAQWKVTMAQMKAAFISTGLGIALVGLTEAVTFGLSKLSEADRPKGSEKHKSWHEEEWAEYRELEKKLGSIEKVKDTTTLDVIQERVRALGEQVKKAGRESDLRGDAATKDDMKDLRNSYKWLAKEIANRIASQRDAIAYERSLKENAKMLEERRKRLADEQKELAKVLRDVAEKEKQRMQEQKSVETQKEELDKRAYRLGARSGRVEDISQEVGFAVEKKELERAQALQKLREEAVKMEEKTARLEKIRLENKYEEAKFNAQRKGNEKAVRDLEIGYAVLKQKEEFMAAGMGEKEATEEAKKKIRRDSYTPEESVESRRIERMMQMGAELGNGGRVLNFGDGLLQYARKQADSLSNIERKMEGMKSVYLAMGE